MKFKRWSLPRGKTKIPAELTAAGYSPLLSALLCSRGMDTAKAASEFLRADIDSLGDPMLLPDMEKAVARIRRAAGEGEKIAVYGDYDVDGITSSCLLTDFLRSLGLRCEMYIPDRIEEGYGINTAAVEALAQKGVSLIITVDCGITAVQETEFARGLGVDMLITDHHECGQELPDACAVVDPKRPDSEYPLTNLAGVGVAFKLACAVSGDTEEMLRRYCDLVAVGTVADVMPLLGENRYIVMRGLKKLTENPRPGFGALIEEAGISSGRLSSMSIGFTLAPRLNAAGRLGLAVRAADLLMETDMKKASAIARELCTMNRDRQGLESEIWNEALAMIGDEKPDRPIVIADEGWHQGVIGIVASRLTEAFGVPAVMISLDGESGKGSCRSWGDFNLYEALAACSGLLEGYGGHAMAAGLTVSRDKIDAFRLALGDYFENQPPSAEKMLEPDINIDSPALLTMDCVESVEMLEPYGNGNPRPLVYIEGAVLENIIPLAEGKHLRLHVRKFGQRHECILFGTTQSELGLGQGDWADLAVFPQINEFRSRRSVQLLVTDVRPSRVYEMCDAVLSGQVSRWEEYSAYTPRRPDFVRVWKALLATGGHKRSPLIALLNSLDSDMQPVRLSLCLCVFAELGLIEVNNCGSELEVSQRNGTGKVNLEDSKLLRMLDGTEQGFTAYTEREYR